MYRSQNVKLRKLNETNSKNRHTYKHEPEYIHIKQRKRMEKVLFFFCIPFVAIWDVYVIYFSLT